jgi:hypothetical protein
MLRGCRPRFRHSFCADRRSKDRSTRGAWYVGISSARVARRRASLAASIAPLVESVMTRSLRQKHRAAVFALALTLPCALTGALYLRKPNVIAPYFNEHGPVVWKCYTLWPTKKITTALRRDKSGTIAIEFTSRKLNAPDLLLYWAAGKTNSPSTLPADARFLGATRLNAPLSVPDEIRGVPGSFILYSLANNEILAVSVPLVVQKS